MTTESPTPDPYEVLGVRPGATEAQIQKAWQRKIKPLGPGSAEFGVLNESAALLLDPERRKAYDDQVTAARAAALEEDAPAAAKRGADGEVSGEASDTAPTVAAEPSRWRLSIVVGAVIAVLAVALAVWQGIVYGTASKAQPLFSSSLTGATGDRVPVSSFAQPDSAQQAAVSMVTTALPTVLSYSYQSMSADQANAQRFLTPQAAAGLAADYQRLISGGTEPGCKSALPPIATSKTVVTATLQDVGVIQVGSTTAQIGAFVNEVTTKAGSGQVTHQNRVVVNLVKQRGTWLIASLTVPDTDHVLTC